MANDTKGTSESAPLAADIAKAIVSQFVSVENLERVASNNENVAAKVSKIVLGVLLGGAGTIGAKLAEVIVGAEEIADPAFQRLMEVAFKDITGVDIGGAPAAPGGRDQRAAAAASLGAALMGAIAGTGGAAGSGAELQPSSAAAESYVTWVTQMALEGWLTGLLGECVTLGQVESLGDLDDALANTLGLGRMTRAVMRPLLDAKVITPFRWHVYKAYRPELLTAGEVARQVARGRWSREKGIEELARQGYSDDRIEALLNSVRKFHSVADLDLLRRSGQIARADAVQQLRDQGYETAVAETELQLESLKRMAGFERALANEAMAAYARGAVDRGVLAEYTQGVTIDPQEANQLREIAEARRALRVKQLSPSQVEACVKAGILSVRDYRIALERDGYDDDAVIALELLLRHELDRQAAIDELRKQQAEQRAREKAERDTERARRKAELERERSQPARIADSDLEAAAIRGLIPLARVEQAYAERYAPADVEVLLELLEDARADYLEREQRAAALRQAGARRQLNVAQLEQAVIDDLLDLGRFREQLQQLGYTPDDAELLTASLSARKDARDAALEQRRRAEQQAKRRAIDLSRFERLVLRGARSVEDYRGLLVSLEFDEAAIAGMVELLELELADAAAAEDARSAVDAELRARGLSLDEWRRAVVLNLKTPAEFERFLLDQRFTADRIELLLLELSIAVADAAAARARREAAEPGLGRHGTPLATVRRAARLGLVSPVTYQERLARDGYNADDIELEMDLLLFELADVRAGQQQADALERELAGRGLSLAETAKAVRAGLAPLEAYTARALELGVDAAAAATLTRILGDELRGTELAKQRRAELGVDLKDRGVALAELEDAVKGGILELAGFVEQLTLNGLAPEDAELLATLLAEQLEGAGGLA